MICKNNQPASSQQPVGEKLCGRKQRFVCLFGLMWEAVKLRTEENIVYMTVKNRQCEDGGEANIETENKNKQTGRYLPALDIWYIQHLCAARII